jgi:outer membrane protein assembly factor BamB
MPSSRAMCYHACQMRFPRKICGLMPLFFILIFLLGVTPESSGQGMNLLGGGYPCFRGDNLNTGRSPYRALKPTRALWTLTVDGEFYAPPSQGPDGTIYAGGTDNVLYALRPNGSIVFHRRITQSSFCIPFSTPSVGPNGNIYIGCRDWTIRSFRPDGTPGMVWHVDDIIRTAPLVASDGSLYFGTDKTFYAIDPKGTIRWRKPFPRLIYPLPALTPDGLLLFTDGRHTLFCLDKDNGDTLWEFVTDGFISDYPMALPDGRVVISCHSAGKNFVYLLNSEGEIEQSFYLSDWLPYTPLLGPDGMVYVASFSGVVYALTIDGSSQWKFKVPLSFPPAMTVDADGTLLVGGLDGYLYAISKTGKFLWKFDIGSPIHAAPIIGEDGKIFIGTVDGILYALE